MLIRQMGSDRCFCAADHHIIKCPGQSILFDVERLEVCEASPLDEEILAAARQPIAIEKLLAHLGEPGKETALLRVSHLFETGFLRGGKTGKGQALPAAPSDRTTFMVNVAQRCNLTCSYCYVNFGHFDYPEPPIARMSLRDAKSLVEHLYRLFPGLRVYGYHFYGGEPLLNFEAIRIIVERALNKAEATGTSADFHITTNGTLLTDEVADFLDIHCFTVYYSFDSDKGTHDETRRYMDGKGSFDDVERNLSLLRDRTGIHLILSSVVREHNCLSNVISQLAASGAQQCKAERVHLDEGNPLALSANALNRYVSDVRSLCNHYIEHLERFEKPVDYRLTSKILQLLLRRRRDFFCPAGERMFGVAANGEIYPCSLHVGRPASKLGDLEIGINEDILARFRNRFSAAGQVECRSCWNRLLCGGGCSAMVDRFGHEDCDVLRAESEAAIQVFHHFAKRDPLRLVALVSPEITRWMNGIPDNPSDLDLTEPESKIAR